MQIRRGGECVWSVARAAAAGGATRAVPAAAAAAASRGFNPLRPASISRGPERTRAMEESARERGRGLGLAAGWRVAGRCRAAGMCSRPGGVEPLRSVSGQPAADKAAGSGAQRRERSEKPSRVSGMVPIQENRHNATAARNEKVRARLRQGINGSSSRWARARGKQLGSAHRQSRSWRSGLEGVAEVVSGKPVMQRACGQLPRGTGRV